MSLVENDRVVETTTEARTVVTRQNVRYLFVISLLVVVGLFAIVSLYMLEWVAGWRVILNVVFSIG